MSEFENIMIKGTKKIGLELNEHKLFKLKQYMDLLLEWNKKINLTAITEEKEIAIKHFIDSLTCLKFIELNEKKVLDIGTGAGFPGIPLKIYNNSIALTLLESIQKKIHFLNAVINKLELMGTRAIKGRAEEIAHEEEHREQYDVVLARAVSKLPVLVEYSIPFLRVGGLFVAMKGPDIDAEIYDSKRALDILGGLIKHVYNIELPISNDKRSIIIIEKISSTFDKYPRRTGLPEKKPLM